jgi:hypothetical protein
MSGFGIGLLLFGLIIGLIGLIKFLSWIDQVHERGWRASLMSRSDVKSAPQYAGNESRFSAVSRGETNPETPETGRSVAETEAEKIHFAETSVAQALARLVIAEELDLTKAVKIGAGKKSGEGYQKWSKLVKAAIEEQRETITPIAGRATPARFPSDREIAA